MNKFQNTPVKRNRGLIYAVTAVCTILALLSTLTWFMPTVSVLGESYSMLDTMSLAEELGANEAELGQVRAGFWAVVIVCAVSVVWAAIPTLWSAIVGPIYALTPMVLCAAQVNDWKQNFTLAIGGNLMVPLAVLVFAVSIIKLILIIIEEKREKRNAGVVQPLRPMTF